MSTQLSEKKQKALRIGLTVLSCLLVLALVIWGALEWILDHYLDKINIVTTEEELIFATETLTDPSLPEMTQTEPLPTLDVPEAGGTNEKNLPLICNTDKVTNVLLLATDARGNEAGRTDVMILCSLNRETNKIVLCSLMRDILATYPSGNADKLNHAHAYGGPTLTMQVLKETFNIQVDRYVKVNFHSFVSVIDALGGVDLYLSADEVKMLNAIMTGYNRLIGVDIYDGALPVKAGLTHLNGKQALAHARNRSIGNDQGRTNRQRQIISAVLQKMKGLSLSELDAMLNLCLPMVTTNLQKSELKELIRSAPSYLSYEIVSTAIPQAGMYFSGMYRGMWAMQLDLEQNCRYLYEVIYGKSPDA